MMGKFINNLILNKVFSFDNGQLMMMNKVSFVMFPARAMSKFVQKIGEDFGDEFLYQHGYDAGMIVAKDFVDQLGWVQLSMAKKMGMVFKMFEVMGFGKLDIKVWDTKNYRLLYKTTNHPVIEHAIRLFGNKEKSCIFYRGIESAHWHNEMGVKNCRLVETQCMKNKKPFCEWSYNYFKK
jgi:predicted hydrocarbon binding protein